MSEYLDRKQVIELYEKHHPHLATYVWEFGQELRQLPIVEERPHGEWIYHKEWEFDGECAFECSKCGMGTDVDYNFCPNCGADMRKEGEAE